MNKIVFLNSDIISNLENEPFAKSMIELLFKNESTCLKAVSYIFCSDAFLLTLNNQYLNHNTLTDVITFPLSDAQKPVVAEIYISIERVKENAKKFQTKYQIELLRVMIHGALHLCGYSDKSKSEQQTMRAREDYYLQEFNVSREANN